MQAAQAGDQQAYARLLRAVLPHIRAAARRRRVPPDAIDDVVQEVLIAVHRARATYDPARPFLPWLAAIADRRALDHLRAEGRRAGRERADPVLLDAAIDPAEPAGAGIARRQDAARLSEAVSGLPEAQREAVEHLALAERSLAETASLTGRSKGALKVNLHRAIRALRGRIDAKDIDGNG